MMSLENFRKELEAILLITKWSPSDGQVREIAEQIALLSTAPTKSDVGAIVADVYGAYEQMLLEGQDNSDLTTLLLMATQVQKQQ